MPFPKFRLVERLENTFTYSYVVQKRATWLLPWDDVAELRDLEEGVQLTRKMAQHAALSGGLRRDRVVFSPAQTELNKAAP